MPEFLPLEFERLDGGEQRRRAEEFRARLATRRSVRHFSAEPVPYGLIETAIRAAASAPSGANQQPWTFVVVGDAETKRRIRVAAEAEEKENYERRMPEEWLEALEPFGTDWRKPFLETAPWLIVVFRQDYGLCGDRKAKHYYVQESVGIATGFLLAGLHLAGLATLTHTPSPMGFLSEILERPKNEKAFAVIPVGYPAAGAMLPAVGKKGMGEAAVVR